MTSFDCFFRSCEKWWPIKINYDVVPHNVAFSSRTHMVFCDLLSQPFLILCWSGRWHKIQELLQQIKVVARHTGYCENRRDPAEKIMHWNCCIDHLNDSKLMWQPFCILALLAPVFPWKKESAFCCHNQRDCDRYIKTWLVNTAFHCDTTTNESHLFTASYQSHFFWGGEGGGRGLETTVLQTLQSQALKGWWEMIDPPTFVLCWWN